MALYIVIRKIMDHPTSAEYAFGTGEDRLGQLKIDKATGMSCLSSLPQVMTRALCTREPCIR